MKKLLSLLICIATLLSCDSTNENLPKMSDKEIIDFLYGCKFEINNRSDVEILFYKNGTKYQYHTIQYPSRICVYGYWNVCDGILNATITPSSEEMLEKNGYRDYVFYGTFEVTGYACFLKLVRKSDGYNDGEVYTLSTRMDIPK